MTLLKIIQYTIVAIYIIVPSYLFAWDGKVVSVTDGDTIKVMKAGKQVKIRLAAIDCPEMGGQPYGQNLSQCRHGSGERKNGLKRKRNLYSAVVFLLARRMIFSSMHCSENQITTILLVLKTYRLEVSARRYLNMKLLKTMESEKNFVA